MYGEYTSIVDRAFLVIRGSSLYAGSILLEFQFFLAWTVSHPYTREYISSVNTLSRGISGSSLCIGNTLLWRRLTTLQDHPYVQGIHEL